MNDEPKTAGEALYRELSTPEMNECIREYYNGVVAYDGQCWRRFIAKADELRGLRRKL